MSEPTPAAAPVKPVLDREQVKVVPDGGRGGYYLYVGRAGKSSGIWLSATSVTNLPAAVKDALNPAPAKAPAPRKPRAAAAAK
jgi:hypothetical protein